VHRGLGLRLWRQPVRVWAGLLGRASALQCPLRKSQLQLWGGPGLWVRDLRLQPFPLRLRERGLWRMSDPLRRGWLVRGGRVLQRDWLCRNELCLRSWVLQRKPALHSAGGLRLRRVRRGGL
jgi:hypothetical protein